MAGQFDDIFGVDTTDENATSNTNGAFDDIFGVNTQAKSDVPSRGLGGFLKDTAIDVTKSVVGLGEAAVGLADIPTGNLVGRGLASIGYDPKATKEILDSGYSEGRQLANKNVEEASGFVDTAKALVENPSAAFGAVAESSLMSLGGAGVARNVAQRLLAGSGIKTGTAAATEFLKRPDVMAKIIGAGAASEGAMTTGSIQEQGRQGGRDWADTILPAAAAGVGTAAIGVLSSKVPGFKDAEASFAKAGLASGEKTSLLSAGKEIAKTMFKEGVLEEMPQSGQEQVFTNLAMGNPWDAGVPEAMAQGMVVGALQGGGMETSSQSINALNANKDQGIKDRAQEEINKAIFNRSITLLNQDREGIDKSVQEINSTIEANNELLNDPQKFADKVKELNIEPDTLLSQITRNSDMNKGLIERINTSLAEQDKVSQSNGNKEVSAEIPTWDTLVKGQNVTLYRGENSENTPDGEWWTTDKAKAAKFGAVTEVSLPAEIIGQHAAMGHRKNDEFVFPTEGNRPPQLANNIAQESLRRDSGWAKSTPGVEDSELLDYVKQTQASLKYRQQQNAPKLADPNVAIREAAKVEQANITAEMDQLVSAYRTGNINGWVNNPENISQDGQGLLSEVQQRQASLDYNKQRNMPGQTMPGQSAPVQPTAPAQQPMTGWAADKRANINNRFTGNEIDRLSADYNPEIPGSEIDRSSTTANPEFSGNENGWINNKQTTPEDKSAEPQQKRKGLQQSLLDILNDRQESLNNEARKDLTNSVFNNEQPGEVVVNTLQDDFEAEQNINHLNDFFKDDSEVNVVDDTNPPVRYTPKPTDLQEEVALNQIKLNQYAKDLKAAYVAGNLEIPQYMMSLDLLARKDIESIEQLLNALDAIKTNDNDTAYARTSSFKAKGKADLERLIKMLGSQMYQGNLAEITIKEVVQNSFDAVKASLNAKGAKGITDGKIDIITDSSSRIIAIRDNGQGMSKKVLTDAFLTVAGTDKSGMASGDASGGFGMAKAAFLYGNEWIEVSTIKDGVRYKFKGTGSDIISDGININTEKADKDAHGTVIVIKVPEYVDVDGKQQYIWFPNNLNEIAFFKQPLINDKIEINLQERYLNPDIITELSDPNNNLWDKDNFQPIKVGKNIDLSNYDTPTKITFDWGTADLYIGKNREASRWDIKHSILSAGVYQFNHSFNIKMGEQVPYNIILNIFPTAKADSPSYPFNVRREGWKDNISDDIKSLNAYVKNIAIGIEAQGTVEQFKNIQSLPRIDINDIGTNNIDMTEFFKPSKNIKSENKPSVTVKPAKITVKDGKVIGTDATGTDVVLADTNKKDNDGKTLVSSFSSEKEAPKAKDFLIDMGIDDSLPVFHNNTTTDYFALAKQNNYSAETFFAEFGSLILKVKDIFINQNIWGYNVLKDNDQSFFFGTSIDKGYHGVNLVVPFKGILINPLAVKESSLPGIVHGLYDTFVHEFAHIPQRNHDQGFSEEVAKLKTKLAADGTDLEIRVALGRLIKKHKNLIELLRNDYEKSTTKNVAKPLNDTGESDALSSRRTENRSEGSVENRNGEWTGSINAGERSTEDGRVQTGNQTDGRDITFKPVDITSKNFKRWFAGSQVKDANGNPLRVYHGSTTFGINKDDQWAFAQSELGKNKQSPLTGLGHFFATDMTESLGYTGGGKGALHTVYLNIKNPVEINSWEFPAFNTPTEARAFAKMKEASGYDGFFIKDQGHYVAFNPEQIKSGEINTGKFDPNNPDIRFQTTEQADLNKINLEDIKKAFPNQEVIQDTDGSISVRFKNGQGLTIKSIQTAGQDFVKMAIETGQMSKTGKILGITIDNEILLDTNFADNKTLWHENKHVLDNLGMITAEDDTALNREFNKLRKSGKLEFALSTHEDAKQRMVENRANMFAQIMVNRESYRNTPFGKVIQRIMDFFQQMLAFGKQSVSGLASEVESGKIYESQAVNKSQAADTNFQVSDDNNEQKIPQADYDALKTEQNNLLQSYAQQARIKFHEMKLLADKALGSISTRLKNVDPELSEHLRWLDFKTSQKIIGVLKTAEPILDITNGAKNALGIRQGGMTADDKIEWNWARLNSDEGKIELLAKKYNLTKHLAALREKLNEIRSEAIEVGYDVGFIDEYWPRVIKDQEGFLQATQEISQRPVFTEAIRAQAKKLGISQEQFERDFPEVKADIISNLILGRTSGIGGPGNIQSRVFETIPKEYAQFYMDADASLMQYVYSMTKKIESRKFFGKVPQKISALKTSKKQKQVELLKHEQLADMARVENPEKLIDLEDRITQLNEDVSLIDQKLDEYKFTNNYTENIGSYIDQMMIDGRIEKKDEKMVRDILDARFHEQGTHGIVNAYKNAAYIDTMGSPMSAITQIGDLAWAMYVGKVWTPSGLLGTGKNLLKAIAGKSDITKEDLGIERIAQEFADGTTLSKAVSKVFKLVGLEKIDSIGKEVLINNALNQFKAQAKADPKALEKLIKPIFKDKSSDVVQEILAYDPIKNPTINPSDNIKMLLYSRLLDFQPVALSEMPEMYLKAGNGRVFYMLKTYTLKQFDVLRREVAHNLKSSDPKQQLQGMINLIQLMALLTLANAGADELKDLLLGKESKFSDRVIENLLTMGGASRYTRMQVTKDGIGSAAAQQILPPMKFLNAASKDANESYNNYISGDVSKFDHARIIDSIPVVGKLYYWHMGRGTDNKQSIAEQEFKKASVDARLFKKQLENSQDKKMFLQSNIDRFKQSKLQENFQAALNRNKEVINKLEKIPSTENVQTRLGQLKAQREQLMQRYLDVAKSVQ